MLLSLALCGLCTAQSDQPRKKQLLVIGEEKGYRHESVSHAMSTIERLGRETGYWDTTIRTDTEALTKKKLEYNAKNLNDFDAVLFFTGGDLEMDAQQKTDFLSFVHDDGKGFIGVHSAATTPAPAANPRSSPSKAKPISTASSVSSPASTPSAASSASPAFSTWPPSRSLILSPLAHATLRTYIECSKCLFILLIQAFKSFR